MTCHPSGRCGLLQSHRQWRILRPRIGSHRQNCQCTYRAVHSSTHRMPNCAIPAGYPISCQPAGRGEISSRIDGAVGPYCQRVNGFVQSTAHRMPCLTIPSSDVVHLLIAGLTEFASGVNGTVMSNGKRKDGIRQSLRQVDAMWRRPSARYCRGGVHPPIFRTSRQRRYYLPGQPPKRRR